jgi:hypothetical protein
VGLVQRVLEANGISTVALSMIPELTRAQARNASKGFPPPPIAELLYRKPWLLPSLYGGRIPCEGG